MTTVKQQIRFSTSDAQQYVGLVGSLVVDLGLYSLRVQDGATPGGFLTLNSKLNLSDLDSKELGRSNLGLGSIATHDITDFDAAGTAQDVYDALYTMIMAAQSGELIITDTSGANLTFISSDVRYTLIGKFLRVYGNIHFPSTADTHYVQLGMANFVWNINGTAYPPGCAQVNTINAPIFALPNGGANFSIRQYNGSMINSQLSGVSIQFEVAGEIE